MWEIALPTPFRIDAPDTYTATFVIRPHCQNVRRSAVKESLVLRIVEGESQPGRPARRWIDAVSYTHLTLPTNREV